jgi:iron complex transport system ATP-binding protein
MTPFRHQSVLTLSGGELQRTFLAQVFAQDPNLILLDEPANHLDLKYQKLLFELLEEWIRQPGRAVLSVVHDLGLARAYGTHALLMHEGRLMAYGSNKQVLNRDNLQKAYGMDVQQWMHDLLSQWEE